jgi:predicted GNAT family N-acyltransferase
MSADASGSEPAPAIEVAVGCGAAVRDDAFRVRFPVFIEEQQIPREEEVDDHDSTDAVHCVVYADGEPVGAGRYVPVRDESGDWVKVGRMAVLAAERGHGYGARVLEALERHAAAHGIVDARLSAQLTARGFYDRAGYAPHGDVYDEVGIPHIEMRKRLTVP